MPYSSADAFNTDKVSKSIQTHSMAPQRTNYKWITSSRRSIKADLFPLFFSPLFSSSTFSSSTFSLESLFPPISNSGSAIFVLPREATSGSSIIFYKLCDWLGGRHPITIADTMMLTNPRRPWDRRKYPIWRKKIVVCILSGLLVSALHVDRTFKAKYGRRSLGLYAYGAPVRRRRHQARLGKQNKGWLLIKWLLVHVVFHCDTGRLVRYF